MQKPKIGVDIDGVVLNILDPCTENMKVISPEFEPEDWKRYYLRNFFQPDGEDADAAIANEWLVGNLYEEQKLVPYAIESLRVLAKKYKVYFVTNRDNSLKTMLATFDSFARFSIPYETIFFAADKPKVIKRLQPLFFIEDNLETSLKIAEVCQCFLFDYPYNRHVQEHQQNGRIIRVGSFEEKNWWPCLLGELKAREMI